MSLVCEYLGHVPAVSGPNTHVHVSHWIAWISSFDVSCLPPVNVNSLILQSSHCKSHNITAPQAYGYPLKLYFELLQFTDCKTLH